MVTEAAFVTVARTSRACVASERDKLPSARSIAVRGGRPHAGRHPPWARPGLGFRAAPGLPAAWPAEVQEKLSKDSRVIESTIARPQVTAIYRYTYSPARYFGGATGICRYDSYCPPVWMMCCPLFLVSQVKGSNQPSRR